MKDAIVEIKVFTRTSGREVLERVLKKGRGKDSVNSSREHLQHLLACCMQYQLPQFAIVVVLLLIPLLMLPETTFVEHHHEHYFAHQQKLRTNTGATYQ
jgi:hypothetical protein